MFLNSLRPCCFPEVSQSLPSHSPPPLSLSILHVSFKISSCASYKPQIKFIYFGPLVRTPRLLSPVIVRVERTLYPICRSCAHAKQLPDAALRFPFVLTANYTRFVVSHFFVLLFRPAPTSPSPSRHTHTHTQL